MGRVRVKLFCPEVPASEYPTFAVRAAHSLGKFCDRNPGREVTTTGGLTDAAGRPLAWPIARFTPVAAEQRKSDPNGLDLFSALRGKGAFDVLFLPCPWENFPAGRLSANPAPIVAYVADVDFDDVDLGSVTDSRRETAALIARDCAAVVFPSGALRDRVCRRYGIPAERTAVVRPAASTTVRPEDAAATCRKLGLPPEFVVCFPGADPDADEFLRGVVSRGCPRWPLVVLGGEVPFVPPKADGETGQSASAPIVRLSGLSEADYGAVLASSRAAVALTSSSTPFLDSHHLDAMALGKPLLCQTSAGRGWECPAPEFVVTFSTAEELAGHLTALGRDDAPRIEAAATFARGRTDADVARDLFRVFEKVHQEPSGGRVRFRTAETACRERRILWLCNHTALHAAEVPLIRSLGFEVYTPKKTPAVWFRSGNVVPSDDEFSTLPRWVLERLNGHNFYTGPLPDDVASLINDHFGTAFVSAWGPMVCEFAHRFQGRILVRAFGQEHPLTYHRFFTHFGGEAVWERIAAIADRFWFAPPYESIAPFEPEPLRSLSVTLPLGMPDRAVRNGGQWTGRHGQILFVCPSINDSPKYYGEIYRDFKYHFGDLPHLIAGSQVQPVDDPRVLGYLPETRYRRLLNDLRVLYYHSREPRHLHYHPLEAVAQGMPVVYLTGGLMEQLGGPDQPGACETEADARCKLLRILDGDGDLIEAIRSSQAKLLETFSGEFVRREWEDKFVNGVMATPLTPGTRPPSDWLRAPLPRPGLTAKATRATPSGLKIGAYLRVGAGTEAFDRAAELTWRLALSEQAGSCYELLFGRRTRAESPPEWPHGEHPRLAVRRLEDDEYLPGRPFDPRPEAHTPPPGADERQQPTGPAGAGPASVDKVPAASANSDVGASAAPTGGNVRRRLTAPLKPAVRWLVQVRTGSRWRPVRLTAAASLAMTFYGLAVLRRKTLLPRESGAIRILRSPAKVAAEDAARQAEAARGAAEEAARREEATRLAAEEAARLAAVVPPDPAPLTYERLREVAARNDLTLFIDPSGIVSNEAALDDLQELPVVAAMYDLTADGPLPWDRSDHAAHREMHVWAKVARLLVFGSEHARREAARRYGLPSEKTAVIPLPVLPRPALPSPPAAREVTRRLGLPHRYILSVGPQTPQKNNVVLLEAVGLLKWRGVKVPPLVLADPGGKRLAPGAEAEAYAAKVRQVVTEANLMEGQDFFVPDGLSPDDLPALYAGAAACACLSRSGSQPSRTALESMLYRLPLICGAIPCHVELAGTDDEVALTVPTDDPSAVADAIKHLLDHPDEARLRANRAAERIQGVTWEAALDGFRRAFAVAADRTSRAAGEPEGRPADRGEPVAA
jgi:glycosyltransferase involved in cell wall biosynthesis